MFSVALLCGGPSPERGISLNSARSVLDHLGCEEIRIVPIYFDCAKRAYRISQAQLYSNTPSDFDFKLRRSGLALSMAALIRLLKQVDIVFPAMHGRFGEDGGIQKLLERHDIPFVGSSAAACALLFDKFTAGRFIEKHGFFALPSMVLSTREQRVLPRIRAFFKRHRLRRAVVKPAAGGSSIGVFSVNTPEQALEKTQLLFAQRLDRRVVIEPFAHGVEFTVIVLQNRFNLPTALIPTEIEMDYEQHQIYDFRRKYLPSRHVTYHCPPRFDDDTIETVCIQAEQLFSLFGMRDFARFDGWIFPDGKIWFSDFNPVSGMEQNSFLFMQAARVGMSHTDVLRHIVAQACRRRQIDFRPKPTRQRSDRLPVNILFGGDTSERQVSLMSGTNVWLKLRRSTRYRPIPFLLDRQGRVWQLPYRSALNHTVEEIADSCEHYVRDESRLLSFEQRSRRRLGLFTPPDPQDSFAPRRMSLNSFFKSSRFVFIALHGGAGENGTLQRQLQRHGIPFNGPDAKVAKLCMDKWHTKCAVERFDMADVGVAPGINRSVRSLSAYDDARLALFWEHTTRRLGAKSLIVKPRADGCSSGVAHLSRARDLAVYLRFIDSDTGHCIPAGTFERQSLPIELPTRKTTALLLEKYVETDALTIKGNRLIHRKRDGWLEITVGIVEKAGKPHALNPSITVAAGEVLTVEEKFQGGTGVNITPPPENIMSRKTVEKIKRNMTALARKLNIGGYARIDAFAHVDRGALMIIEVNALPGLTPSTVLYHQGLAEKRPLSPQRLLELLIENKFSGK